MTSPPPELLEAAAAHMARQHTTKPDPLRNPDVMILELTDEQAKPFAGLGESFAIIGRGSYPGYVGKLCLFALPVDTETARAANRVAMGTHAATKIRTSSKASE
jgi:hypothetical protein